MHGLTGVICSPFGVPCHIPFCHLSCVFCQGLGGAYLNCRPTGGQSSESPWRGLRESSGRAWQQAHGPRAWYGKGSGEVP